MAGIREDGIKLHQDVIATRLKFLEKYNSPEECEEERDLWGKAQVKWNDFVFWNKNLAEEIVNEYEYKNKK